MEQDTQLVSSSSATGASGGASLLDPKRKPSADSIAKKKGDAMTSDDIDQQPELTVSSENLDEEEGVTGESDAQQNTVPTIAPDDFPSSLGDQSTETPGSPAKPQEAKTAAAAPKNEAASPKAAACACPWAKTKVGCIGWALVVGLVILLISVYFLLGSEQNSTLTKLGELSSGGASSAAKSTVPTPEIVYDQPSEATTNADSPADELATLPAELPPVDETVLPEEIPPIDEITAPDIPDETLPLE